MNLHTLPINDIIIENRQRLDLGAINEMADSLREHGLIQPVVINQQKRLIAGQRRIEGAKLLGWTEISVVFRETLSEDELHELELEENIRRKNMSWQEIVLNISTIHALKVKKADYDPSKWGQKETGALLGMDQARVSIATRIAPLLRAELGPDNKPTKDAKFWPCESLEAAWRLRLRLKEDEAMADLAKSTATISPTQGFEDLAVVEETIDLDNDALKFERERYDSNPLNTVPFDEYWAEKQRLLNDTKPTIIPISRFLFCADSISFMHSHKGEFDHIITDIPYAIDMDMLNQQNPHDLDTIYAEHDVKYNLQLISDFFLAAFAATKEHAFVITWCDAWLFRWMGDLAIAAGFSVQRWPYTWCKTTKCLNQCANQNRTKNTEIAIICRKPGTATTKIADSSFLVADKDDLCEKIEHKFAKPFAVWQDLVEFCSLENQLILEPFAGRGSGVVSMLRLRRKVVAVELQQNHFNYLTENVKQHYLSLIPNCQFS